MRQKATQTVHQVEKIVEVKVRYKVRVVKELINC